MKIAMVGLGRMGGNMAERLLLGGHEVYGFDPAPKAREALQRAGGHGADSLQHLVEAMTKPAVIWVMVPAGQPTESTLQQLSLLVAPGDLLIDGGNSHYKDSIRQGEALGAKGIHFLDAGTSGGIWGLKEGYCLMVGGTPEAFETAEPALRTLAPPGGLIHTGPVGSGHFVKMVHNGIEYGLLQAYGEGFELLNATEWSLDLPGIAKTWRQGSVVRSWLLDLLADALQKDPGLDQIRGYVDDSGEGRWTVQEAIDRGVPAPVAALSLFARFRSRQEDSFQAKVIAALRNEFGGHATRPE